MRRAWLPLAALLASCSFKPAKIFADYTSLEVREVGRSLHCNTATEDSAAYLFVDDAAVRYWQSGRKINLLPPAAAVPAAADTKYALVEMGQRPTGGHGLAVSRAAVLRGELLILSATFIRPAPDRMVTQALTSPCVLVQLPPGRYSALEVQDQTGATRASGDSSSINPTP